MLFKDLLNKKRKLNLLKIKRFLDQPNWNENWEFVSLKTGLNYDWKPANYVFEFKQSLSEKQNLNQHFEFIISKNEIAVILKNKKNDVVLCEYSKIEKVKNAKWFNEVISNLKKGANL